MKFYKTPDAQICNSKLLKPTGNVNSKTSNNYPAEYKPLLKPLPGVTQPDYL